MQIKAIMVHFAFLREIFYGIGAFFQWIFQILPIIGIVANWIFTFVIIGLLVYWCVRIVGFGSEDRREVDHRQPHNFID